MEIFEEALKKDRAAKKNESKKRSRRLATYASIGLAMLSGFGFAVKNEFKGSDTKNLIPPDVIAYPDDLINPETHIVSWNVQGKAAKLSRRIERIAINRGADAVFLQEVKRRDVQKLHENMPGWFVKFGLAERIQHGGYGNVIMTRQKPEDIQTATFNGTSAPKAIFGTTLGVIKDVARDPVNPSFNETKDAWQETRGAIALTIKVRVADKLVNERLVTSHIAPPGRRDEHGQKEEIHIAQREELENFIGDNKKKGRPLIVFGDFNAHAEEITTRFRPLELSALVPSESTMVRRQDINDFGVADDEGVLGSGETTVLKTKGSDHWPVLVEFDGDQTD
jgi:exonuclease III